ncbi:UNVERIFIED_CONTAM: hypothetical protein FKN15_014080 [Acipenser sinensis]
MTPTAQDVTEPDVSIAEEYHDAIPSEAAPTSPDHSFGPAVEELLQRSEAVPMPPQTTPTWVLATVHTGYAHRHILQSVWPDDWLAPCMFPKCMDAILAPLPLQVIRMMNYLDDWLICPSRRKQQWPTQRL